MTQIGKIIGANIQEKRKALGLTQEQLGESIGWLEAKSAKRNLSNYERGERTPSYMDLIKIADALECTTDYLLGHREPKTGLSAKAISILESLNKSTDYNDIQVFLSDLLCSPEPLTKMSRYYRIWMEKVCNQSTSINAIEDLCSEITSQDLPVDKKTDILNKLVLIGRSIPSENMGLRYAIIRQVEEFLSEMKKAKEDEHAKGGMTKKKDR